MFRQENDDLNRKCIRSVICGGLKMKIAMAQINPVVGDIKRNLRMIQDQFSLASRQGANLVVFPELALVGYPPKDLLVQPWFIRSAQEGVNHLKQISSKFPDVGLLVGVPMVHSSGAGNGLYNSAVLLCRGEICDQQPKSLLPTDDVFDEARYFDPADQIKNFSFMGMKLGVTICEDVWNDPEFWPGRKKYQVNPLGQLADDGAELFINISASPFYMGKEMLRYKLLKGHAQKYNTPIIYVNQVGGNDELIFDGRSLFLDNEGRVVEALAGFKEDMRIIDITAKGYMEPFIPQDPVASVYEALVLGIRDYLGKTGFSKIVLGLSGGIDSALTCCLACAAVGSENVLGISMPSVYSSRGSVEDSRKLAQNLGVAFKVIPIADIQDSYLNGLSEHFAENSADTTEENIQARIRGNLLMAFSNKFGHLLLSTGNKSEMAVGYCTLYGDMSGGLSVLSDVPKTLVYQLSEYVNRIREIIPRTIIEKAPSAELKPDQKDQDTLPPYPILDRILAGYIEEAKSADELVAEGLLRETVEWVIRTVNRNEYKRRQAAPGLKVTSKAFGGGRRMPIAAKFEWQLK